MSEDFEIVDVENYATGKDKNFSHQTLVMKTMNQAIENGACEMLPGTMQEVRDPKTGKLLVVYKEDTRKRFIESVKSCMMIMICDYTAETKAAINAYKKKVGERKKYWLNQERLFFAQLDLGTKNSFAQRGIVYYQEAFNRKLFYGNNFIEEELEVYRGILEQLSILTKTLDFYAEEVYEA